MGQVKSAAVAAAAWVLRDAVQFQRHEMVDVETTKEEPPVLRRYAEAMQVAAPQVDAASLHRVVEASVATARQRAENEVRRVRKRPSTACLLGGVSLGERTQLGQQLGIHILVVAYRNTTYYSIKVLRSRCLVRWASHQDWALDVRDERGTRLLTPCRHDFCFPRGCAELLAKTQGGGTHSPRRGHCILF